jgi:hypothetical protein
LEARSVTVAGRPFRLSERTVLRAVGKTLPEPIRDHFVVVNGRRWPPKQVLALATGLDRADFTTHQARAILRRLGFPAGRLSQTSARRAQTNRASGPRRVRQVHEQAPDPVAEPATLADALRPFIGQWVAIRGVEVLVAADRPSDVVAWLTTHGQRAQSVFRVPDSEQAVGGAAPL